MKKDTPIFNSFQETLDLSYVCKHCIHNGTLRRYAKGDIFVQEGKVCKNFGLIKSGYFKYSTINTNGDISVLNFAFESECITDLNHSVRNQPSEISITAGTNSEAYIIPMSEFNEILASHLGNFQLSVYMSLYSMLYERLISMHRKSPAERYRQLLKDHPDILEIVSLKDIASYLMITPVHLSRIRHQILNENFPGKKAE